MHMQMTEQPILGTGYHIKLGASGRMIMPAALREQHHMRPGDTLVVRSRNGAVEVRTRDQVLKEMLDHFASLAPPERILSEELIAERRMEAQREAEAE
jgi:bifunctional DNA-binding transcriptional regulator/antitoxin component of YhaV-PrlF toxin-antitoxin module